MDGKQKRREEQGLFTGWESKKIKKDEIFERFDGFLISRNYKTTNKKNKIARKEKKMRRE